MKKLGLYGKRVTTFLVCGAMLVTGVSKTEMKNSVMAQANENALVTFDITAQQMVDDMGVGINIGNSLDSAKGANATETNWGKPVITRELLHGLKEHGFRTVRIPTTWTYKLGNAPDYTVNASWMNRVEEVVNYALDEGMYVILNTHHEGEHIIPNYNHKEQNAELINALWTQIATRFNKYGGNLIFEVLNEPREEGSPTEWSGGTEESRAVLNYYNQVALNAIRATGGNNSIRKVMLPTVAAAITDSALNGFVKPNDPNVILSVHAYSPYEFAMKDSGVNTWGSEADKIAMDNQMKKLYDKFVSKGTPVIIGEFGTTNKGNLDSRIVHAKYYVKAARKYGITCVWWDNGTTADRQGEECFGIFDRYSYVPLFPNLISSMIASEKDEEPIHDIEYEEGENLIDNLSFYNYQNSNTYGADGTVTIQSMGESNWQPHVSKADIVINAGKDYVFRCKLNSSVSRSVTIHFQIPSNNYETLASQTISLEAGKTQEVEIIIPAQAVTKTGVKCTICLGTIDGVSNLPGHTVKITEVSLRERTEVEETTKAQETTTGAEETSKAQETTTGASYEQSRVEINGFQFNAQYEGFRTIYSVADPKSEVVEKGLIYGLKEYANESEMVIQSNNSNVYSFKATDNGRITAIHSEIAGAQSYAMTMKNIKTKEFYSSVLMIRAYVKLKNGTYKYSEISKKSVYEIADYLYRNKLMPNESGHNYLYNEVLSIVNGNYVRVGY